MMQMQREESASAAADDDPKNSLSFRLDSPEKISAVDRHISNVDQIEGGDEDEDDDFDFSFIRIPDSGPSIAADDIFSGGKIRPIYPVFNRDLLKEEEEQEEKEVEEDQTLKSIRVPLRRLFIEEERDRASSFSSTSSSSASLDELDGVPAGTYCVWTPSKDHRDRRKKSRSTGSSMSFRWRLRDLVVGRSQSDGKEKFVFIPIAEKGDKDGGVLKSKKESSTLELEQSNSNSKGKKKLEKSSSTEVDLVTAQRRMMERYGQDAGNKGSASGRRRSSLPYKPDVVGFFASVNGLTRSHRHDHPF